MNCAAEVTVYTIQELLIIVLKDNGHTNTYHVAACGRQPPVLTTMRTVSAVSITGVGRSAATFFSATTPECA